MFRLLNVRSKEFTQLIDCINIANVGLRSISFIVSANLSCLSEEVGSRESSMKARSSNQFIVLILFSKVLIWKLIFFMCG